jgi:hypothetical protein
MYRSWLNQRAVWHALNQRQQRVAATIFVTAQTELNLHTLL